VFYAVPVKEVQYTFKQYLKKYKKDFTRYLNVKMFDDKGEDLNLKDLEAVFGNGTNQVIMDQFHKSKTKV
jgi:hypothetical protein